MTSTIMDIIQSELINDGHNEFVNNGEITFFDDEFSFIQKIMRFDSDVNVIVSRLFFKGITLENEQADKRFKKMFVNKFLNRRIGFQTVETFASQLIYTTLLNEDFLNEYFVNLDKYLSGENKTGTTNNATNTSDQRNLHSDLPQNQLNISLEDTVLDYASTNTINRNKSQDNSSNQSTATHYNLDNLERLNGLLELVFDDIDRRCFLHVY